MDNHGGDLVDRSAAAQSDGAAVLPDLAYHDYEGVALDLDERPRLQRDLSRNNIMLLRNHGTLTVGRGRTSAHSP